MDKELEIRLAAMEEMLNKLAANQMELFTRAGIQPSFQLDTLSRDNFSNCVAVT